MFDKFLEPKSEIDAPIKRKPVLKIYVHCLSFSTLDFQLCRLQLTSRYLHVSQHVALSIHTSSLLLNIQAYFICLPLLDL